MVLIKKIFIALALITMVGCVTTHKAKVNFDKNTDIDTSSYKTFAWLTQEKLMASVDDINPVMKVRVANEIEQAFINRGYALISDAENADFTISYTVGNRDKIKVSSYPPMYNLKFGWGRRYYGGYYGGLFGPRMTPETHVRQYSEGKLAIDVYDVKSRQPAWHGWAVKRIISTDKGMSPESVKAAVKQVIAQF